MWHYLRAHSDNAGSHSDSHTNSNSNTFNCCHTNTEIDTLTCMSFPLPLSHPPSGHGSERGIFYIIVLTY